MNETDGAQNFFALFRSLWRLIRGQDDRWRKVRWLFSLLGPYRRQVLMMLGALILATGATLAPPFLVGRAISAVLDGDTTALILIVAGFLVAALVGWGTSYVQTYLVGWVGERALQDLRIRIFTHVQQMSIGFFTRNRPGVLISRITNDVDALDQLISTGCGDAVLQRPDARRGRGDHAGGGRPAGPGGVPDAPAARDREPGLPDRRGERLSDHAGSGSRR